MAQTGDHRRIDVFRIRLDASGAPELNTKPCVSSRGLEISQKVERACQPAQSPQTPANVAAPEPHAVNVESPFQKYQNLLDELQGQVSKLDAHIRP